MKKEEILKGLEDLVEDRQKFTIDANLEWIVNHEVEVLRSAIEIIKTTPEVPAQMQFIDLLDGMPLYKWERLKNCIDREFKSQANKTLFKDSNEFRKNLELETIH